MLSNQPTVISSYTTFSANPDNISPSDLTSPFPNTNPTQKSSVFDNPNLPTIISPMRTFLTPSNIQTQIGQTDVVTIDGQASSLISSLTPKPPKTYPITTFVDKFSSISTTIISETSIPVEKQPGILSFQNSPNSNSSQVITDSFIINTTIQATEINPPKTGLAQLKYAENQGTSKVLSNDSPQSIKIPINDFHQEITGSSNSLNVDYQSGTLESTQNNIATYNLYQYSEDTVTPLDSNRKIEATKNDEKSNRNPTEPLENQKYVTNPLVELKIENEKTKPDDVKNFVRPQTSPSFGIINKNTGNELVSVNFVQNNTASQQDTLNRSLVNNAPSKQIDNHQSKNNIPEISNHQPYDLITKNINVKEEGSSTNQQQQRKSFGNILNDVEKQGKKFDSNIVAIASSSGFSPKPFFDLVGDNKSAIPNFETDGGKNQTKIDSQSANSKYNQTIKQTTIKNDNNKLLPVTNGIFQSAIFSNQNKQDINKTQGVNSNNQDNKSSKIAINIFEHKSSDNKTFFTDSTIPKISKQNDGNIDKPDKLNKNQSDGKNDFQKAADDVSYSTPGNDDYYGNNERQKSIKQKPGQTNGGENNQNLEAYGTISGLSTTIKPKVNNEPENGIKQQQTNVTETNNILTITTLSSDSDNNVIMSEYIEAEKFRTSDTKNGSKVNTDSDISSQNIPIGSGIGSQIFSTPVVKEAVAEVSKSLLNSNKDSGVHRDLGIKDLKQPETQSFAISSMSPKYIGENLDSDKPGLLFSDNENQREDLEQRMQSGKADFMGSSNSKEETSEIPTEASLNDNLTVANLENLANVSEAQLESLPKPSSILPIDINNETPSASMAFVDNEYPDQNKNIQNPEQGTTGSDQWPDEIGKQRLAAGQNRGKSSLDVNGEIDKQKTVELPIMYISQKTSDGRIINFTEDPNMSKQPNADTGLNLPNPEHVSKTEEITRQSNVPDGMLVENFTSSSKLPAQSLPKLGIIERLLNLSRVTEQPINGETYFIINKI